VRAGLTARPRRGSRRVELAREACGIGARSLELAREVTARRLPCAAVVVGAREERPRFELGALRPPHLGEDRGVVRHDRAAEDGDRASEGARDRAGARASTPETGEVGSVLALARGLLGAVACLGLGAGARDRRRRHRLVPRALVALGGALPLFLVPSPRLVRVALRRGIRFGAGRRRSAGGLFRVAPPPFPLFFASNSLVFQACELGQRERRRRLLRGDRHAGVEHRPAHRLGGGRRSRRGRT